MKHFVLSLIATLWLASTSHCQLPNGSYGQNYTVTDQFGVQHNLHNYLDEGYTVFMIAFATWSGPDWSYFTQSGLEDLYFNHGPIGAPGVSANTTNEVMIIMIEGDPSTTDAELAGGAGSQGNWLNPSGTPVAFPMANEQSTTLDPIMNDYAIAYFPTVYRICPNRLVTEVGQLNANDLYATVDACPAPASFNTDPAILTYNGDLATCGSVNVLVTLQNNGLLPLTSCTFTATGGTVPVTYTWNGSLNTYDIATVNIGTVTMTGSGNLNVAVTSFDQNNNNSNVITPITFADDGTTHFVIDILFDRWPEECSWAVTDETGSVVASADYALNTPADNSSITEHVWLPSSGCYTFTAYDAFGDGFYDSQYGNFANGAISVRTLAQNGSVFSNVWNYNGDYNYSVAEAKSNVVIDVTEVTTSGCTNPLACNYNPSASNNDGSCILPGNACNDGNPLTTNDIIQGNCSCSGTFTSTNCGASDYDFGNATYGIYPTENTALIDGCMGESYYQPFYILVPSDAGVLDPAYTGVPISNMVINSMTIGDVPVSDYGLTYSCLNNNCIFLAGNQYCLNLFGVPNQAGAFDVTVNVTVNLIFFGMPIELPYVISTYSLAISANCSPEISGCTNSSACNYNPAATINDGSCLVVGSACNDFNPNTINDVIQSNCNCAGTAIDPGCSGFTVSNNTANPTCAGLSNGFISVNTSGTSAPFSYSWNNGSTSSSITNIGAGAYSVMITDAVGCTETINFNITAPTAINVTTTTNAANCYGAASGSASALVTGGTAPYAYAWNTSPIQNTAQISNVPAGNYTVNITDANGCVFSSSATISQPTQPLLVNATSTAASCSQSDGSASAIVNGNTAAIQYLWSNGQTGATASNLSAGAYTVTINSGGCSAQTTVNVNNINAPVINHVNNSLQCFGDNTGSINTVITGGTQPYQYLWSNGGSGTSQTGLTAGNYTFIVIDNVGCQASIVVTLTQPNPINIALSATPTSCSGTPQGALNATVSGGTQPYLYSWSNGSGGTSINNLSAGQYALSITDANGCAAEASASVVNPDGVLAYANATNVSCFSGTDGAVEVIITDGTPPYTFEWNNGTTGTALLNNLAAGEYSCVITDANGCSTNAAATVDGPQGILPEILGQINVSPFSTETYSTAFQQGFSYTWSATGGNVLVGPNSNFIEVQWGSSGAGEVTLTISDGNGCEIINTLIVSIGGQSIYESPSDAIKVFPVPFMDYLTIQAPQEFQNVPFAIYDAVGKVIVSGKITQEINVLPVHQLACGAYMLKLNQQTFQLVKL